MFPCPKCRQGAFRITDKLAAMNGNPVRCPTCGAQAMVPHWRVLHAWVAVPLVVVFGVFMWSIFHARHIIWSLIAWTLGLFVAYLLVLVVYAFWGPLRGMTKRQGRFCCPHCGRRTITRWQWFAITTTPYLVRGVPCRACAHDVGVSRRRAFVRMALVIAVYFITDALLAVLTPAWRVGGAASVAVLVAVTTLAYEYANPGLEAW